MPRVTEFRALRFRPGTDLGLATAPPYDVIAPDERDELESASPDNIVRITLGAELSGDDEANNRYTRAAQTYREWVSSGLLVADENPRLYLYRSDFTVEGKPRASAGIVGALELEELGAGGVYGHEKTRPGPKADRLALMRSTPANLEPLWFFASSTIAGFRELVDELAEREPLGDVTDIQGVRHRTWALSAERSSSMRELLSAIPLVVADGHHRYETSVTYRNERRVVDGSGPWDYTLALISDPLQFSPELLPIHRIVPELDPSSIPGLKPFPGDFTALRQAVEEAGHGTIGVAAAGGNWTVSTSAEVDTVWLADKVFAPNSCDVTYEHNTRIVKEAVDAGATAFLMAAIPVPLVADKALAGVRLPPKTTLFWPKPRTGLLMRALDPQA